MLRATLSIASNAFRNIIRKGIAPDYTNESLKRLTNVPSSSLTRNYTYTLTGQPGIVKCPPCFLQAPLIHRTDLVRSVTKFSLNSGKRKTVKAVLRRFYRLNWGMWIRGKCGRNKKLYKKSGNRKRRLRRHVFTNATQSWLLDKMVNKYWRKPKYYVDDPYEPYHQREEFAFTRRKPYIPFEN